MEIISTLSDYILHLDEHLAVLVENYGIWTNAILFLIIFMETGFVVTPFLPGDSLLFAVGAFAARDVFNLPLVFSLLFAAAVLGDTVNYWIGNYFGEAVFKKDSRFIKKEYLEKTQKFYEKHGGKTIILARFIPIVRTFAPFVAGVGTMKYNSFIVYNIFGAFLWVSLFMLTGYFFGNIPSVQNNFEFVIFGIIIISVLPMLYEYLKKLKKEDSPKTKNSSDNKEELSSRKTTDDSQA